MFATFITLLGLASTFASVNVQSYICQFPDVPVITSPVDGDSVTAGAITFTGTATASSHVVLSIDGQDATMATADDTNNFQEQLTLPTGTHDIGITSNSPCGDHAGSPITLTVIAPPTPPASPTTTTTGTSTGHSTHGSTISGGGVLLPTTPTTTSSPLTLYIEGPSDAATTQHSSIYVYGTTSAPATITIQSGGKVIAQTLTAQSSFGLGVSLAIGTNTLDIEATSGAEHASVELHITRVGTADTTKADVPWWRTVPGRVFIIITVVVVMVGLLIWLELSLI